MGTCVSKAKIHNENQQHKREIKPHDISYHGGVPKHMYHTSMSHCTFKDGHVQREIQWRRCIDIRYRNTPYLPPIPETILKNS